MTQTLNKCVDNTHRLSVNGLRIKITNFIILGKRIQQPVRFLGKLTSIHSETHMVESLIVKVARVYFSLVAVSHECVRTNKSNDDLFRQESISQNDGLVPPSRPLWNLIFSYYAQFAVIHFLSVLPQLRQQRQNTLRELQSTNVQFHACHNKFAVNVTPISNDVIVRLSKESER